MNIIETAQALRNGSITATQLVTQHLDRANEIKHLNAFAYIDRDGALAEAAEQDALAKRGQWRGALHGIPITIKDLFNVKNMPTRGGAKATLPPIVPNEAVAVTLLRKAGAIVLGKTNMVEIALGITGENMWTGNVRNPHDPTRQTGGSSSGSGASLGAGVGFATLGSDTAGSIRIPAALCGVVGFKPTWGKVSLEGALPLCWSCDHAGPLTHTVADAALLYGILTNSAPAPQSDLIAPRFGVPYYFLEGALSTDARREWERLLKALQALGATLVAIDMPLLDKTADVFVPMRAESSITHRTAITTEPENFSPFVRAELQRGLTINAIDYLDALAQQRLLRDEADDYLRSVDGIIMPTVPTVAQPIGTSEIELESGHTTIRAGFLHLSRPFALLGLPTVSLPFAWVNGLPLGVQVAAPFGADTQALNMAQWIEGVVKRTA